MRNYDYNEQHLRITCGIEFDYYRRGGKEEREINYGESTAVNNYTYFFFQKNIAGDIKSNSAFIEHVDIYGEKEAKKYLEYIKNETNIVSAVHKLPGCYLLDTLFRIVFDESKISKDGFIGGYIDGNKNILSVNSPADVLKMVGLEKIKDGDGTIRISDTGESVYDWIAVSYNLQLATYLFQRDTYCLLNLKTGNIEYIPAETNYKLNFPYISIGYQKIGKILQNLSDCLPVCEENEKYKAICGFKYCDTFSDDVEESVESPEGHEEPEEWEYCDDRTSECRYCHKNNDCKFSNKDEDNGITVKNIPFIPYMILDDLFAYWACDEGDVVEMGLFSYDRTYSNIVDFFATQKTEPLTLITRRYIGD